MPVLVLERLGRGATGPYLEQKGGCDEADYARLGRDSADQIKLALEFFVKAARISACCRLRIARDAGCRKAKAALSSPPGNLIAR
jgi:hypothetical protein